MPMHAVFSHVIHAVYANETGHSNKSVRAGRSECRSTCRQHAIPAPPLPSLLIRVLRHPCRPWSVSFATGTAAGRPRRRRRTTLEGRRSDIDGDYRPAACAPGRRLGRRRQWLSDPPTDSAGGWSGCALSSATDPLNDRPTSNLARSTYQTTGSKRDNPNDDLVGLPSWRRTY